MLLGDGDCSLLRFDELRERVLSSGTAAAYGGEGQSRVSIFFGVAGSGMYPPEYFDKRIASSLVGEFDRLCRTFLTTTADEESNCEANVPFLLDFEEEHDE